MDARSAIISTIIVTLGSLIVAYFTKRSAKEQTAITGYVSLTKDLRDEVERLVSRVNALESERVKSVKAEEKRRGLARQHERWDWSVVKQLRSLTDDHIPDPPPLDTWEQ